MSSQTAKIMKDGLWTNNPIFVQVLGICSTLAVTNSVRNTLIMVAGVTFATAFGSVTLSAMKDLIPRKVRMIVQVLVLSFYVIIIDIVLRAYLPEASKQLGPYVGLIITNCILMGRAEGFAAANKPWPSFVDGIANGLGYGAVLLAIAIVRELLGFGTVAGFPVISGLPGFTSWTIMIMAPSAFFLVALALWASKVYQARIEAKQKAAQAAAAAAKAAGAAPAAGPAGK